MLPAEDSRSDILRDTLWYVVAVYAAQAVGFVGNILTRRYLGPADSGVLALVTIVSGYAALTHCGLIDGGNKLIPYWFGKARTPHAERLGGVMTTGSTALACFGALLGAAVVAAWWHRFGIALAIGLLVAAVRLPIQQRTTAYAVLLRAKKRFIFLSKTRLVVAVVNIALIVWLVRWRGLYAMYLVLVLVALVNLILWWPARTGAESGRGVWPRLAPRLSMPALHELFAAGLPILVYGQLFLLIQSLDNLMIARLSTMAQVGLYNFGSLICMAVWSAPNGFSAVMFPRSQERFARSGAGELRRYTLLPVTLFSGTVVPALVGAAWILLPPLVAFALPAFHAAIVPARILLLGCYFLCLVNMPIQYLITTNAFRRLIGIELAVILAMGVGDWSALRSGGNIAAVAAWTAICFAALFVLLVSCGLRGLASPAALWSIVGKVFAAFLYFCFLLGILARLERTSLWIHAGGGFGPLLSLVALALGLAPIMVVTVLRSQILSAKQIQFLREAWWSI